MPTTLTLRPPADYLLSRDVCSYGYFVLAPNLWHVPTQTLYRMLDLSGGPAAVRIAQPFRKGQPRTFEPLPRGATREPGKPAPSVREGREIFPHEPGAPLTCRFDRTLAREEQSEARAQITRMLRLDEDADHATEFHAVDPRWASSGHCRLFRSPTFFEDVVKTVTSCNVAWPSTVNMNLRLCEVLGRRGAFPTAQKLARTRPGTLRARCRVGYRDRRMVELARLFCPRGGKPPEVNEAYLADPATPDDEVFKFLKSLPGIGPYAAGNIMMLLGRYSRLAIDTESIRHGKTILGMKGTDGAITKRLARHYEPFGEHRFRSYWFELWTFYEDRNQRANTWVRDEVAKAFTAAKF
jgi:3-methyladenine DNA glycosylase/8-oxoguanine DNA glycosylase